MHGWFLSGSMKANRHWQSGSGYTFYPADPLKTFAKPKPAGAYEYGWQYLRGLFRDDNRQCNFQASCRLTSGTSSSLQNGPTEWSGVVFDNTAIYPLRRRFYKIIMPKPEQVRLRIKEISRPECFGDKKIYFIYQFVTLHGTGINTYTGTFNTATSKTSAYTAGIIPTIEEGAIGGLDTENPFIYKDSLSDEPMQCNGVEASNASMIFTVPENTIFIGFSGIRFAFENTDGFTVNNHILFSDEEKEDIKKNWKYRFYWSKV